MQQPTSTEFSDPDDMKKKLAPPPPVDQTHLGNKINQNFIERTRWTIVMLVGFVVMIAAGQIPCALLVVIVNFFIFREINGIKRNYQKQVNIPITKFINWYFYGLANYYCFGHFLVQVFPLSVLTNPVLHLLFIHHSFISFCLFVIGFVAFVLSLKQGYLKYQFRVFAWIVLATIMVVFQSWLIIANIMKGMIWFVLPVLLIVCNDIFAYLVGYFFGKHQLIALSPKKTWEGYLGGAFFTFLFSYILTSTLANIPGFTCPVNVSNLTAFHYPTCNDSHITDEIYSLPILHISLMKAHFHVFILSLFASTVGPFGGFFASGLKRSIKIKDFSNLIPGHGGLSDRMDCQMIMGSFTYFYLGAFLSFSYFDPSFWLSKLSPEHQLLLYNELKNKLASIQI